MRSPAAAPWWTSIIGSTGRRSGTGTASTRFASRPAFSMNTVPHRFWMLNRYDDVREALQRPEVFTNRVTSALQDPATKVKLIPQNAVGREHVKYRQVLNPWFSPGSVKRIEPMARARCIEMIDELAPRGSCDLAVDFAMLYPTEVFLAILGLPTEDGRVLLPLVEGMFRRLLRRRPRRRPTRTSRSCTATTRRPSTSASPRRGTRRQTSSRTCSRRSQTVRRCRTKTCRPCASRSCWPGSTRRAASWGTSSTTLRRMNPTDGCSSTNRS